MQDLLSRKMAFSLLRAAMRITPENMREWNSAMLSELEHVEGSRAALMWALGCSWVCLKSGLKETLVRRQMLVPAVASVVAVLLLFLIPGFRQGVHASLVSWQLVFPGATWPDSKLKAMAAHAEERRDAKALAFVATRLTDASASARAANEAVRLDPGLTWVYYPVALRHPRLPDSPRWAARLREWDPQNGVPFLMTVATLRFEEKLASDFDPVSRGGIQRPPREDRKRAAASALSSPRFDDYMTPQLEVDRDVVRRYALWDPVLFMLGFPAKSRIPLPDLFEAIPPRVLDAPPRPDDAALLLYARLHAKTPGQWANPPSATIRTIQILSVLMLGFAVLLILGTGFRRRLFAVGLSGAIGLFVSATSLCVLYLPHARAFSRFIGNGDIFQLERLQVFYTIGYLLPSQLQYRLLVRSLWWSAVIMVGLSLLTHLWLWLRFRSRESV